MKKLFIGLSSLVLVACGTPKVEETTTTELATTQVSDTTTTQAITTAFSSEETAIQVTMNIYVENELKESVILETQKDAFLLDVMKEQLKIKEDDGFVTAINGVEQDKDKGLFWMFDVNGEMSPVGAKEVKLSADDVIDWKLESFE